MSGKGKTVRLTAGEARVASLAAAGLTASEIAARLGLELRVVEASLATVYRKRGTP